MDAATRVAALRARLQADAARENCMAVCDRAARFPCARRNGSVRAREEAKTPTFPPPERAKRLGMFTYEEAHTKLDAATGDFVQCGIRSREEEVLADLLVSGQITEDVLRGVIAINGRNAALPKRLMDFALTNFSKRQHSICASERADGGFAFNDAFDNYNSTTKKYNRLLYDIFCRGSYLFFTLDGALHTTTVGQLIFMLQERDLKTKEFFDDNLAAIRTHYDETLAHGRAARRQQQQELQKLQDTEGSVQRLERQASAASSEWTWATPLRYGGSDVSLATALGDTTSRSADGGGPAAVITDRSATAEDDMGALVEAVQPARGGTAPRPFELYSDAPAHFDDPLPESTAGVWESVSLGSPSLASPSLASPPLASRTTLPRRRHREETPWGSAEHSTVGSTRSSNSSTAGGRSGARRHELTRTKTKQTCGSVSGAFDAPLQMESKVAAQWAAARAAAATKTLDVERIVAV